MYFSWNIPSSKHTKEQRAYYKVQAMQLITAANTCYKIKKRVTLLRRLLLAGCAGLFPAAHLCLFSLTGIQTAGADYFA